MSAHLWEIEHPYYCSEGNFYVPGTQWSDVHTEYASWPDFAEDWAGTDPDMNLVFRWDWRRQDPKDITQFGFEAEPDKLEVFWVLQRKAILRSTVCVVTEADEPAVREWLETRAKHLARVWEPLLAVSA